MTNLKSLLERSSTLDATLAQLLGAEAYEIYDDSPRIVGSASACSASWDHGKGLRVLIGSDLPTPAIGLMRLQYEALTRGVWLFYAANDTEVDKLTAALTPDAEKAANKTPMLAGMLAAIDGKAPAAATLMLKQFKDVMASALNSYVHGGIHAIRRQSEGHPEPLLMQVVTSSNALLTMSAMMLAILSGDAAMAKKMSQIQPMFADCLPDLIAPSQ
jgi:hypothetical protein